MNKIPGRPMTQSEYAEEWEKTGEIFYNNNHYSWMIQQLGAGKILLEIGCGSGNSTLSLANSQKRIVSLEKNEIALQNAYNRLKSSNISVDLISFDDLSTIDLNSGAQVRLVHGDVFDGDLGSKLKNHDFDALICWLIGASPDVIVTHFGTSIETLDGTKMPKYRAQVQKRCFELGQICLKSGGIVQIVNRGSMQSWNDKDAARDMAASEYQELAGPLYSVTRGNTYLRKIGNDLSGSQMMYVAEGFQKIMTINSVKAILK